MGKGLVLLAAALLLAGCGGTPSPPPPSPLPTADIASEEVAVYAAAIRAYLGRNPDPLVLADQTALDLGGDITTTLAELAQQLPGLAPETLASLGARNSRSEPVRPDMALPFRYVLISPEEERAIFQSDGGGWDEFYRRYPNAQGIMRLSRVGFSGDVTQAVVYVGNQSHYLAGAGYYYLLARENGAWRVVTSVMTWIS
jgi:hypothetical protein